MQNVSSLAQNTAILQVTKFSCIYIYRDENSRVSWIRSSSAAVTIKCVREKIKYDRSVNSLQHLKSIELFLDNTQRVFAIFNRC